MQEDDSRFRKIYEPDSLIVWTLAIAAVFLGSTLLLTSAAGQTPDLDDRQTWILGGKVTPADGDEPGGWGYAGHFSTRFGSAVAVDGNTMVVGTAIDSGAWIDWVYVFHRTPDGWTQVAKFEPDSPQERDAFGYSVAVDDDDGVIVVGNPTWDEPGEEDAGRVHIYERTGPGSWAETATFTGPTNGDDHDPNEFIGPEFGDDVDVSGDKIAVGAPTALHGPEEEEVWAGAVFVMEKTDDGWTKTDRLNATKPQSDDHFGTSVAISGDTIMAGGSDARRPGQPDEVNGVVWVFEQGTAGEWETTDRILAPTSGGTVNACFGFDIALHHDLGVVGNPCWQGQHSQLFSGNAYVLRRAGEGWTIDAALSPSDRNPASEHFFGRSVDVDGSTVAVGAPNWPEFGVSLGAAYVYEKTPEGWSETANLRGPEENTFSEFGESVSISGDTLAVGTPGATTPCFSSYPPANDPIETWAWALHHGPANGEDAGAVYFFDDASTAQDVVPAKEDVTQPCPATEEDVPTQDDIPEPPSPPPVPSSNSTVRTASYSECETLSFFGIGVDVGEKHVFACAGIYGSGPTPSVWTAGDCEGYNYSLTLEEETICAHMAELGPEDIRAAGGREEIQVERGCDEVRFTIEPQSAWICAP